MRLQRLAMLYAFLVFYDGWLTNLSPFCFRFVSSILVSFQVGILTLCFLYTNANTHGNAAALFIVSLRQNIRVAVCKLFIVQLNASVVRWLYRRSLSASGGCCDFSSSIYLPFGASRTFMHGAVVMACIESKVTKWASLCWFTVTFVYID